MRAFPQRGIGGGFDGEADARGESNGTQQAQAVLGEARLRIADGADDACLEIRHAADVVDDFAGFRHFKQSVDGEVPPPRVFLRRRERHRFRAAAVAVAAIGAEGGDLDVMAAVFGDHHAEVRAHFVGTGKKAEHFGRHGGGGDVVVFRFVV